MIGPYRHGLRLLGASIPVSFGEAIHHATPSIPMGTVLQIPGRRSPGAYRLPVLDEGGAEERCVSERPVGFAVFTVLCSVVVVCGNDDSLAEAVSKPDAVVLASPLPALCESVHWLADIRRSTLITWTCPQVGLKSYNTHPIINEEVA